MEMMGAIPAISLQPHHHWMTSSSPHYVLAYLKRHGTVVMMSTNVLLVKGIATKILIVLAILSVDRTIAWTIIHYQEVTGVQVPIVVLVRSIKI